MANSLLLLVWDNKSINSSVSLTNHCKVLTQYLIAFYHRYRCAHTHRYCCCCCCLLSTPSYLFFLLFLLLLILLLLLLIFLLFFRLLFDGLLSQELFEDLVVQRVLGLHLFRNSDDLRVQGLWNSSGCKSWVPNDTFGLDAARVEYSVE